MSFRARLRRVIRSAAAAAALLLVLLAAAVALVFHTPWGLEGVRLLALAQLRPLLLGQVSLQELQRLDLSGLSLHGLRARDPSGNVVLELEQLELGWSPLALLSGRLELSRLALRGVRVDLADLSAQRGLVAAFQLRAPAPPAPAAESAPLGIQLSEFRLEEVSVRAQLEGLGNVALQRLSARGSFRRGAGIELGLASFSSELWREGAPRGSIESASGRLISGEGRSTLGLSAQLGGAQLRLSAEGQLPGVAGYERAPLALSLQLEHLDAHSFAAFGKPEWGVGWSQPLALSLHVSGSVREPRAEFSLSAPAGAVEGSAVLSAERRAELRASIAGLSLADAWLGLPSGRLDGTLTASAELADLAAVPLRVHFEHGRLDATPLPELTASGRLLPDRLRELSLQLRADEGSLQLSGELEFVGAGRGLVELSLPRLERLSRLERLRSLGLPALGRGSLTLRSELALERQQLSAGGTLRVRELGLPTASLGALDVTFQLGGALTTPELKAILSARALNAGALRLDAARVQLAVKRTGEATQLSLAGTGSALGEPFRIVVQRARLGEDASLELRGVQLEALGQQLALSGRIGARAAQGLVLDAPALDLASIGRLLPASPPLAGRLALHATARGELAAPALGLELRGSGLRVGQRPIFELSLEAALDAARGHAQLNAQVESEAGPALDLKAQAAFARGAGASWSERSSSLHYDAVLGLQRTSFRALSAWLPEPLPLEGEGRAQVHLSGSLREPELRADVRAHLPELVPGRSADVRLEARYSQGEARAAVTLLDAQGVWFDARALLAHPESTTAAWLRDAARLVELGNWQTGVFVARRPLGLLPGLPALPVAQQGVQLEALLGAWHESQREPQAELQLRLNQPESSGGNCTGGAAQLAVLASLKAGRLVAQLDLQRNAQRLVHADARSEVQLRSWLAGAGTADVHGLDVDAQLEQVELGSLPYVCKLLHGELSGSAHARDLLSQAPELSLALRALRLSLDRRQFVDAKLDASVQLPRARVGLVLQHGGTRSTLQADVPLRAQGGSLGIPRDEPLSAQLVLDRLPFGALVPENAPISRVSGSWSGKLQLGGTRAAPDLSGYLEPQGVSFTTNALAQPLSEIAGRIALSGNQLSIEHLSARDGDGTLELSGRVSLPRPGSVEAALSLVAREFPLRQQGRSAGLLDASARVQLGLDERALNVGIQLDEVSLWLRGGELRQGIDLEAHPDVIDPRAAPRLPADADPAAPAPAEPARPLTLTLEARDSIWVRREDFAAKLSAHLSAETKQGHLRVRGPVSLQRGYLQLLGKVFDLRDKGSIEFVGSDPPDPVLDITADANTRGQSNEQRVSVKISGRARAPVIAFSIGDKPVSAGEAAQALFAGGAATGAAVSQVQSFVGGLTSSLFALSARREIGEMLPILVLEPATETTGSRVRAGFELDSLVPAFLARFIRGVYVEGIIASGNGQQQQDTGSGVLLELYLPNDLLTSGQYGPGETWSLDLAWEP